MIVISGRPRLLRIGGVSSTARWQSCPISACTPERGKSEPTFRAPPWARPIAGMANMAPAAAVAAISVRRVILVR